MKKSRLILLGIIGVLFSSLGNAFAEVNVSPIVQVISYYDVYGKYPMMMGWGSASIINKDGVIISNDHVVDDGKGALASAFSVCITKEINKKPKCDYTASLIKRDDKLDISILKIDPLDIYGNKVNYSDFKTIDIDYNYEPNTGDDTIAIGYPWVGADTISQTKGIVSGVSEYNGYKYIKTDTLIAGGNSGGAFIKGGKLIGIPTFGIGGWGDNSMGYALSIKEAKDFIEENKSLPSNENSITKVIDFNLYRKTIEKINEDYKLSDNFVKISVPKDYEVTNYTKDIYTEIGLKTQKDTGVNNLSILLGKTPNLDSEKKILYYFEKVGFYNKDWQKLIKKNIGGINFYSPVDKNDLSNGESYWGKSFKAIVNGKYVIDLNVQAPFYDEKRNKEVKKEVDLLLNSITFNTGSFDKVVFSFDTNIPKISIKTFPKTIQDTGNYSMYFDKNLYEYMAINIGELQEYNGKGENLDKIYDVELKNIDSSKKAKITFKGFEGYIYCSDNGYYNYYYSYYPYYGSNGVDENGNTIDLKTCNIKILFPKNDELNRHNFLNIDIFSKKNNLEKNIDKTIDFLTKYLDLGTDNKNVNIPNIIKNQVKLNFTDIKDQSESYKNMLKILTKYNIIDNGEKFDGEKVLKWGELLKLYTKAIYNFDTTNKNCEKNNYSCEFSNYKVSINGKDKSLDSIFKELGIDYDEYVMNDKYYLFGKYFGYKLAGINIGEFNEENVAKFENSISDKEYYKEKEKIDNFKNSIYGKKQISIQEIYTDYSQFYFHTKQAKYLIDENKIVYTNIYNPGVMSMSYKKDKGLNYFIEYSALDKKYNCSSKDSFKDFKACSLKQLNDLKEINKKYDIPGTSILNYYLVLNKADFISSIIPDIDLGLFDKELAKRKDAEIESK